METDLNMLYPGEAGPRLQEQWPAHLGHHLVTTAKQRRNLNYIYAHKSEQHGTEKKMKIASYLASRGGHPLGTLKCVYSRMICQLPRNIVGDAGFESGTFSSSV